MAKADYRLCDLCGSKAFYDANLNYERINKNDKYDTFSPPFKVAGVSQYEDHDDLEMYGTRLDMLGDWAVLCTDCALTHQVRIVRKEDD